MILKQAGLYGIRTVCLPAALFSAFSVVGKHSCRRIVNAASRPAAVWHPESLDHSILPGIKVFEYLPV